MLSQTGMDASGYALTVTLFSIAYTLFEVPSNWVMKHWVRPSVWLGALLAAWGVLTIGYVCAYIMHCILGIRNMSLRVVESTVVLQGFLEILYANLHSGLRVCRILPQW